MIIDQDLKQFLHNNMDYLNSYQFSILYEKCAQTLGYLKVRDLTTILYSSNVDPLKYVGNKVPDFFLYGKLQSHLKDILSNGFHIPEGIEVIGFYAFKHCKYLDKIYLPSTLKEIEEEALLGIDLKEIYYNGTLQDWKNIVKGENYANSTKTNKLVFTDQVLKF